jgi:UrcA family protein
MRSNWNLWWGLVSLAMICPMSAAFAQEPGAPAHDITVSAGRSIYSIPVQTQETVQPVNYGDLDLATAEGRAQLNQRIDAAAVAACDQMREQYPLSAWDTYRYQCVDDAIGSARVQKHEAIALARQTARAQGG